MALLTTSTLATQAVPSTLPEAVDLIAAEEPNLPAMAEAEEAIGQGGAAGGRREISYGELSMLSHRAAHHLLALGVRGHSLRPVATRMCRGTEWYVVYVAASRLAAPLAALSLDLRLDPASERRRNSQLLAELQPQVLIVPK